jgi:hypothetical protein
MAKQKRDAGLIQVKARMPIALHRRLQRDADRHGQTINAEILRRLESSFQSDRMFEGVLTPDNAKLVRMIAQAAMMAGDWRNNKSKFDAFEVAVIYIIYAAAFELVKREGEKFDKTKPSIKEIRADESDEMGSAIAQLIIANEMPHQSVREVMQEHANEHFRRHEKGRILFPPRKGKPLVNLQELVERIADKKGEKSDD